jgi:hypothetical protein
MGCDTFSDASPACGIAACNPNGFVRNGLIDFPATSECGEHVELRLPPTPILSQGLQQSRAQRQIAIFAALARHHADDHPLAVNVADLEMSEFAAPHAGAVERH